MTFASFFSAIAQQESGGNYGAVNSRTGALGKYQIMPGNVGPWARQYLGRSVTPQQFIASPHLQDQLASAVLQHYYRAYGPRGAAAAWYSGSPTGKNNYTRFLANEPSIGEYVDSVMSKMRNAPDSLPPDFQMGRVNQGKTTRKTVDNSAQPTPVNDLLGTDVQPGTEPAGLGAADQGAGLGKADAMAAAGMQIEQMLSQPQDGSNGPVPDPTAPQTPDMPSTMPQSQQANSRRQAFLSMAEQYIGTPYVYGGTSANGVDCSGLPYLAAEQSGFKLPRVSWDQIAAGQRTSLNSLRPGDLVGFGGGGHVAIWLGNGKILEAAHPGTNVRVRSLGKGEQAFGVSLQNYFN